MPNREFLKQLKERIATEIPVRDQRATVGTYFKCALLVAWYLASVAALLTRPDVATSLLLCLSLALSIAAIGFNIFHDSVHGSFSYRPWVNRSWAFLSCSLIGASHFVWKYKHNFLHHQYPNVQNWDDDLETRDSLRLSPHQAWMPRYRHQEWLAILVYGLSTLEWIYVRDFIRYFSGRMNPQHQMPRMSTGDHVEFWVSKGIYFGLTLALPLCFVPVGTYLVGLFIVHFTTSLILAAIFQPAHVMEESAFPAGDPNERKLPMGWAELQLATTVNFAPSNRLLNWYCGGLNFQVEHHLLPNVCHTHYRRVAPIVQATASEFGLPYHSLPSQWAALKSHVRVLKRLGRNPA